jgi:hypothetical protein
MATVGCAFEPFECGDEIPDVALDWSASCTGSVGASEVASFPAVTETRGSDFALRAAPPATALLPTEAVVAW